MYNKKGKLNLCTSLEMVACSSCSRLAYTPLNNAQRFISNSLTAMLVLCNAR